MMFCSVNFFSLNFFIYTISGQLSPGKSCNDAKNNIRLKAAVMCSETGNCTCLFGKLDVTVKCTSVGDELYKIASGLPRTTTHL